MVDTTEDVLGGLESDSDSDSGEQTRERFRSSTQDTTSITVRQSAQANIPDTLGRNGGALWIFSIN